MKNQRNFKAKRMSRTYKQRNNAVPDVVFSLLCPVREKEWAPHFQAEIIYSESGFGEKGCIWTTPRSDGSETLWTITNQDIKNLVIEMLYIVQDLEMVNIHFQLSDNNDGTTTNTVTYTHTALTEAGNQLVEAFTKEKFERQMVHWETAINYYLKTGQCIPLSHLSKHFHNPEMKH